MNRIQELEAQNLQDSWSILYFKFAENLLRDMERGEELVRHAVREYGRLIGKEERRLQQKKKIKINLQNFYIWPQIRYEDPRIFEVQQKLNEQVALTDVIRCPFASAAERYGAEKAAKLFCEEFTPSCIGAYSEDIAQVNISEVLTEKENNRCRIASYFRPGNLKSDYRSSFDSFEEPKTNVSGINQNLKDAKAKWNQCAEFMIQAFCSENPEVLSSKEVVHTIADFLQMRSKSMEQKLDIEFIKRNCAVPIEEHPEFRKRMKHELKPEEEV